MESYVAISIFPTLKCPIVVPPLFSVCEKNFQSIFQTDFLKKSIVITIVLCCLHSRDHRRLIYEHRALHISIIFDFKAFFLPSTPLAYSDPPLINFFCFQPPPLISPLSNFSDAQGCLSSDHIFFQNLNFIFIPVSIQPVHVRKTSI